MKVKVKDLIKYLEELDQDREVYQPTPEWWEDFEFWVLNNENKKNLNKVVVI